MPSKNTVLVIVQEELPQAGLLRLPQSFSDSTPLWLICSVPSLYFFGYRDAGAGGFGPAFRLNDCGGEVSGVSGSDRMPNEARGGVNERESAPGGCSLSAKIARDDIIRPKSRRTDFPAAGVCQQSLGAVVKVEVGVAQVEFTDEYCRGTEVGGDDVKIIGDTRRQRSAELTGKRPVVAGPIFPSVCSF
jgi:hypothetical protein